MMLISDLGSPHVTLVALFLLVLSRSKQASSCLTELKREKEAETPAGFWCVSPEFADRLGFNINADFNGSGGMVGDFDRA